MNSKSEEKSLESKSSKIKKLIESIKSILNELIEENNKNIKEDKMSTEKQKKLSFYSKNPASISLSSYYDRILKYTNVEESTIIVSLIYIDRICEYNNILLFDANIHRIIFTSIVLAIKYNEDDFYTNIYYAKVGGITLKEFNTLEYEFVKLIRYSLFVDEPLYEKYKNYLYINADKTL